MEKQRVPCVVYCRVSTERQLLNRQIELCRAFAEDNGYHILRLYKEKISGSSFDRPQYQNMLDELDDLKPEVLIVSDFDRFSRGRGYTSVLAQEALVARGIRIIGIMDAERAGPDPTPEQQMFATFRAEIAWYERMKIRQRMKGGFDDYLERQLANKLEEGERPIGRQPYIFNEGDIGLIQALLKDHATKKHIYEKYFRRTRRFKKMHLKTFYLVCKRYGL